MGVPFKSISIFIDINVAYYYVLCSIFSHGLSFPTSWIGLDCFIVLNLISCNRTSCWSGHPPTRFLWDTQSMVSDTEWSLGRWMRMPLWSPSSQTSWIPHRCQWISSQLEAVGSVGVGRKVERYLSVVAYFFQCMTMLNFDWLKDFCKFIQHALFILKFRQTILLSTVQLLTKMLEFKTCSRKRAFLLNPRSE